MKRLDEWVDTTSKFYDRLMAYNYETRCELRNSLYTEFLELNERQRRLVNGGNIFLNLSENPVASINFTSDSKKEATLVHEKRARLWEPREDDVTGTLPDRFFSLISQFFECGEVPGGWMLYGDADGLMSIPDALFDSNLADGTYKVIRSVK